MRVFINRHNNSIYEERIVGEIMWYDGVNASRDMTAQRFLHLPIRMSRSRLLREELL